MDEFEEAPGRRKVLRKYGLSQIDFDRMLEEQGGVCAICERKPVRRNFCVDHDHSTGRVRGLLCNECNIGLGKFKDSSYLLKQATAYLEKNDGSVPRQGGRGEVPAAGLYVDGGAEGYASRVPGRVRSKS